MLAGPSRLTLEALASRSSSSRPLSLHSASRPCVCQRPHGRRVDQRASKLSSSSSQQLARGLSSSASRPSSSPPSQNKTLSDSIRSLMRTSAQPVALVNTFLPPEHAKSATRTRSSDKDTTPDPDPDDESEERWIHGATLSSFSSISLQPPLISFAIRTPSRLSDSLKHAYLQSKDAASRPTSEPFPSPSSSSSLSSEGEQNQPRPRKGHFILNLLAAEQVDLAGTYARPGLDPLRYPLPPPTSSSNDSSTRHPLLQHPVTPTAEAAGIPRLDDALGSFTCAVVDAINLASYSPTVAPAAADPHSNAHAHAHAPESSILYIAQILNVYKGSGSTPLLYCNQKFVKPAHGI